jgi:hypothetical protein
VKGFFPITRGATIKNGGNAMKLKKLFSMYLVVILFGGMVFGLALPRDANAVLCKYSGYVVLTAIDPIIGAVVVLRQNPLDKGMYMAVVGGGGLSTGHEISLMDHLRSAQQNQTKVTVKIESGGPTCVPTDFTVPGGTLVGYLLYIYNTGEFLY